MALPTSGPLTLDDIHVEAGGTTATTASINDADIRGLLSPVPASGSTMDFSDWYGASNVAPIQATGGTITTINGYRYHDFKSGGTFNISAIASGTYSNTLTIFLVAGGGGGAGKGGGGGGGADCLLTSVAASTGNKTVTIGAGGAGVYAAFPDTGIGGTGGTTSITGLGVASVTGGLGGVNQYASSSIRQHGGDSGNGNIGGSNVYIYSSSCSTGGGAGYSEGGQNAVDEFNAARGGNGYTLAGFTDAISTVKYAGGGGGVAWAGNIYQDSGEGRFGGSDGSDNLGGQGPAASPNRGGGGGGNYNGTGGDGGSGRVIIKYEYS